MQRAFKKLCPTRRRSHSRAPHGRHSVRRQNRPRSARQIRNNRRGASTVEFALVCPLFILLLFGMIEFGRMVMVKQVVINASREGARQAILEGTTTEEVKDVVETYLTAAGITVDRDDIELSEDPQTVQPGDPVMVRVWIPYEEVSWLPGAMYLGGSRLTAACVMRKEGIQ